MTWDVSDGVELDQFGEPQDFSSTYRFLQPRLVQYATRNGARDAEGVADLALFDTFKATQRGHFPNEATLRAYAYQAVRSHVIGESRKTVPVPAADALTADLVVDDETEAIVDRDLLSALLTQLTPDQREVIQSVDLEGQTVEAVARRTGRRANAIYQMRRRALERLRRSWPTVVALLLALAGGLMILLADNESTIVEPTEQQGPEQSDVNQPDADNLNGDSLDDNRSSADLSSTTLPDESALAVAPAPTEAAEDALAADVSEPESQTTLETSSSSTTTTTQTSLPPTTATQTTTPAAAPPTEAPESTTSTTVRPTTVPAVAGVNDGDTFMLRSAASGRCMDVPPPADVDGTSVHVWTCSPTLTRQQWRFEATDGGYFRVVSVNSGKALSLNEPADVNGSDIVVDTYQGFDRQQWSPEPIDGGGYHLGPRSGSWKVATVSGVNDGSNITGWGVNDGLDRQIWFLDPVR